jgi:hypothetical protein
MKRFFLLFAAVVPLVCLAQTAPQAPVSTPPSTRNFAVIPSAAACPVQLTSADPASRGRLLLAGSAESPATGGLDLRFRNRSGKAIQSMDIAAYLKIKRDKYQLDATTAVLHLTLHGTSDVTTTEEVLRMVPLSVFLYGVSHVQLEAVTFADGTVWTPAARVRCGVDGPSAAKLIADAK